MKKESGLTLMELMVAIAIISILSGMAVPNMISWRNNMQFNSALRMVKSAIDNTRMNAIKSNARAKLEFTDGGRSFDTVKWDMAANNYAAPLTHQLPPGIIIANSKFSGDRLQFTSRGLPLGISGGTLTLKNTTGNLCRKITIASTGSCRIADCQNP